MKDHAANSIQLNKNTYDTRAQIYAIIETMGDISTNWKDVMPIMEQKAKEIVQLWDARYIMGLVELFPHILPKKYHGVDYILDINDNCDWVLIFE